MGFHTLIRSQTSNFYPPKPPLLCVYISMHHDLAITSVLPHQIFFRSTPPHQMASASRAALDQRMAMAKRCSHEGVMAGVKAAAVATIASAVPTIASVRMLPWAKANLNPTAQALIVSTAAGMAYFIVADRTVLASARKNSFRSSEPSLSHVSA